MLDFMRLATKAILNTILGLILFAVWFIILLVMVEAARQFTFFITGDAFLAGLAAAGTLFWGICTAEGWTPDGARDREIRRERRERPAVEKGLEAVMRRYDEAERVRHLLMVNRAAAAEREARNRRSRCSAP